MRKALKGVVYVVAILCVVAGASLHDYRLGMAVFGGIVLLDFYTHKV